MYDRGCSLGFPVYYFYKHYTLEDIDYFDHGCRIGVTKRNTHAYADNVVLFSPTSSGLQMVIDGFSAQSNSLDLANDYDMTKVVKLREQDVRIGY